MESDSGSEHSTDQEIYEEMTWPEDRELPNLLNESRYLITPVFEVTRDEVWDYQALSYARQLQLAFRWSNRLYIGHSNMGTDIEIDTPYYIVAFSMNFALVKTFFYPQEEHVSREMRIEVTTGEHYVFVVSEGDRWIFETVDGPHDQKAMFTMIIVRDKLPYSIPIINPIRFLGKGGYTYSFRLLSEDFDEAADLWMQNFKRPEFLERLEMLHADYRYVHKIWPHLENTDFGIYIIPKLPEAHEMMIPVHSAEILLTRF